MSKQTAKSTHKSLGLVLDRDIEVWSSQAKRRAKNYQKNINSAKEKKYKNSSEQFTIDKSTINNQENLSIILNSSLNTLREKTKSQRSVSSTISNRIKYLEVDLKRKKQMAEIAKNKYQKMMETRTRSFQEKSMLNRQRQFFMKNHYQSVTLQASRIKFERNNSIVNSKNLTTKNRCEANKIKQRRLMNERLIQQRQQMQVQKKRRMVQKSHKIHQIGRQKLKYLSKAKELQAKQMHNKKILQEYMKVQMQRKKTNTLSTLFRSKVKEIQENTRKYASELIQYEQFLGLRFNQKFKNMNSTVYITH